MTLLRAALLLSLLALTSFGFELEEGDYQDSEETPPPPPPQVFKINALSVSLPIHQLNRSKHSLAVSSSSARALPKF